MNVTVDQLAILIMDQALRNAEAHVQRCARRINVALEEYNDACNAANVLSHKLQRMREVELGKAA